MIKINLLPEEEVRSKLELFDQLRIGIVLLIAVVVVIFFMSSAIKGKIAAATAKNSELQSELNRLTKLGVEKKDREFRRIKKELETKIDVIWELKSQQAGPVHLLDSLSRSLPDRVWLESFSERSKGKVIVKGVAYSNSDVARFMTNLEQSARFSEVVLNRLGQTGVGKQMVMGFSITMKYHPPKSWTK